MILILSTPNDYDTNCVIDWLREKKIIFFRLNDEDFMEGIIKFCYQPLNEAESFFEYDSNKIFIKQINVVWFRKFGFLSNYEKTIGVNNDLYNYVRLEFRAIGNLLFKVLENKKWLFKRSEMQSKLEVLKQANNAGLTIPRTIITSSKKELSAFYYGNNENIITKSIGDAKLVKFKNSNFMFHTHKITNIMELDDSFSPSLFQEYIDKNFEIRVFYLDGECYSMAIFSQNNPRTIIDFRDYDVDVPNRFVPYKLPRKIESSIRKLMQNINLNTGSIDLLVSKKNKDYYFLEVNPAGQFGMVSFPCNYNLHLKVADFLIKLNND